MVLEGRGSRTARRRWWIVPTALLALSDELLTVHGASDDPLIHLGMNRLSRITEVDELMAKYQVFKARETLATDSDHESSSAHPFSSVLRSVIGGVASKIWWGHQHSSIYADDIETHSTTAAVETRIRTGQGSHTITVYVGGQPRELIIDTGSGKTAFICVGCLDCGAHHSNKPFRMTNHSTYVVCDSENPGNEDMGGCMSCVGSKCRYGQRYVEGDAWEAYKVQDIMSFTLPGVQNTVFEAVVQFGCIYQQSGCFNQQESDGIMGFSRHPDSIFEQFYRQGVTQSRIFAQCLASDGGALTLGGVDMQVNTGVEMYTPLRDTGYQYWTVDLESITVGAATMDVPASVYNADRGCVFDSGTTFVYLPTKARSAFLLAWRKAMGGRDEFMPVSDTFYHIEDGALAQLPKICFHFANNAKLCMGAESYMYRLAHNQYAGTLYFSDMARSTIIGASALAHHNIIYDIDNNRIGMAEADCDAAVSRTSSVDALQQQMIALELHPGGDTFMSALDKEYWGVVALASVAIVAVAGLVVTVWEGVSDRNEKKQAGVVVADRHKDAPVREQLLTDGDSDFAFFLMLEEGDV